jgi:hypothetical protein
VVAAESQAIGKAGISVVSRATGISRPAIRQGIAELKDPSALSPGRIRRQGGGCKKAADKDRSWKSDLQRMLESTTRGDPEAPLRWTCKSIRQLTAELTRLKHSGQPVICHFPPGTGKWNRIEHRLFSYTSQNWRGRPLRSFQAIVNLIAATTPSAGHRVHAELNTRSYPSGLKVSDQELAQINIRRDTFHGDWNYEIRPRILSAG